MLRRRLGAPHATHLALSPALPLSHLRYRSLTCATAPDPHSSLHHSPFTTTTKERGVMRERCSRVTSSPSLQSRVTSSPSLQSRVTSSPRLQGGR